MFVSDFYFQLPPELIAQHPVEPRDHSRLMVLERRSQSISDRFFYDLPSFLNPGDLLVFNDTRVIPARLYAVKEGGGGGRIEVFLLKELKKSEWECLVYPGKRGRPGDKLVFNLGIKADILEVTDTGSRILRFPEELDFREWLQDSGEAPLPPYITEKLANPERYQTIYSKYEGSVAAPTAGLHFTAELLAQISNMGVKLGFLTLHVGIGTFRPVKTESVEDHLMHAERFTLPAELVTLVEDTKKSGGRVIAVGTTAVRVLESQTDLSGKLQAGLGETNIFIYPGYKFKTVDAMVTNFHLPRSTLLMLVSTFAGREFVLKSYQEAIQKQYRFFSFGDAMFIC